MKLTHKQAREMGLETPRARRTPQQGAEARERVQMRQKLFVAACKAHGLPVPVAEYEWARDLGRRWRFDWLFEGCLAVEVVGGVWVRGHHSRGQDQIEDMERRNEAQIQGYVVLEFTPQQIEDGSAFPVIKRALLEV